MWCRGGCERGRGEALNWWLTEHTSDLDGAVEDSAVGANGDPLSAHLGQLLVQVADVPNVTIVGVLQQAIRRWTTTGRTRPSRRGFPPPLVRP